MRRKFTSLLLIAVMLISILTPAFAGTNDSSWAEAHVQGQRVTITGQSESQGQVTLLVTKDSNGTRQYIDQCKVDKDGNFEFNFTLLTDGIHTARLNICGNKKEISFNVGSKEPMEPEEPEEPEIPEEPEEPEEPETPKEANKDALQKKVDEAKKLVEGDYTEKTWNTLQKALEAAEEVLAEEEATQDEIDKAVDNLSNAIEGLEKSEKPIEPECDIEKISIQIDKTNLKVGDKPIVKVIDDKGNLVSHDKLEWYSSNENIVKIQLKGPRRRPKIRLVPLAEGNATITVHLKDDKSIKDEIKVNVVDNIKTVYIRIEGYDHTVMPRTKIEVPLEDISSYLSAGTGSTAKPSNDWGVDRFDNPTHAHAIVKALIDAGFRQQKKGEEDRRGLFDFQDYGWGLYIAMIDGEREFDHGGMSGWMYRVNGEMPAIGCQGLDLRDNDDIVWYYGAFGFDNVYTEMFADRKNIDVGESVEITAKGYTGGFATRIIPLEGATVLIREKGSKDFREYKIDGNPVKTNKQGKAKITFDKPGKYEISLVRYSGDRIDIVRPVPVEITVHSDDVETPKSKNTNLKDLKINGKTIEGFNKETLNYNVRLPMGTKQVPKVVATAEDDKAKVEIKAPDTFDKDRKATVTIKVTAEDGKTTKTYKVNFEIAKDTTPPEITTSLDKNIIVEESELTFTATAKDDIDGKVPITVNLNGKKVEGADGKYTVNLKEGRNTITIQAQNKAGNSTKEQFTIIYAKIVKCKMGEEITIEDTKKPVILKTEEDIALDLTEAEIKPNAKIKLEDVTKEPKYKPQEKEAKVAGKVVKFNLKGIKVSKEKPAILTLPVNKDVNIDKAAIYYFNEKENKWEYQETKRLDGKLVIKATHFSVYGVLTDEKAPEEVKVKAQDIKKDKATLKLSAKDFSGIKEYHIYRDGKFIAKTTDETYTDKNLKENTKYKYKIKAVDKLNNISEYSPVITVKTEETKDEDGSSGGSSGGGSRSSRRKKKKKKTQDSRDTVKPDKETKDKKQDKVKDKEIKQIFKDIDNVPWAKDAIEEMTSKGIIKGRTETSFAPKADITRAEFAAIIVRMLDYKPDDDKQMPFKDVSTNKWYYKAVKAAFENGIIRGKSETSFDPEGEITRQEMAVIIANVIKKESPKTADINKLNTFTDKTKIADWAKEQVALAVQEGIISGMGDGRFAPKENANRAQAAVMLYRLYKNR